MMVAGNLQNKCCFIDFKHNSFSMIKSDTDNDISLCLLV
jgi:hypothetical protein